MPRLLIYTSNLCLCSAKFEIAGWRLFVFGLGKKTLQTCSGKHFLLLEKNTIRNQFFIMLFLLFFNLSALKSLLSKLFTSLSANKKNSYAAERITRLYTVLSLILFQSITARLFSIATLFSALSILTILLHKCQMKSFENINILMKEKLFFQKRLF